MIILSDKAKRLLKLTGKIIAGIVFALIFFMAGIVYEAMNHPHKDISTIELMDEITKIKTPSSDFYLNVDDYWQLRFLPCKQYAACVEVKKRVYKEKK